jgi:CheY-like chemotaxis protein
VRVAIAEDSVLLRDGVARILGDNGFEVVAQCGDANDLLLKVDSYPLDVAIVDIRLPPTHSDEGLRAALEIRARHPSVGVLVCRSTVQHLREARHPLDRERVSARAGGVDVPPRLTRGGPQYPTRHRRRWRSTNYSKGRSPRSNAAPR